MSQSTQGSLQGPTTALLSQTPTGPLLLPLQVKLQPHLTAFGKEKSIPLSNLSVDEVAKALESVVKSRA
uniref:Uncharacterized protein n=1 Tax=Zonotrichia albicollis TaxID=44394 RepID=A0A8D2ND41_ZONAL